MFVGGAPYHLDRAAEELRGSRGRRGEEENMFRVVEAFGVRVLEVEGLRDVACLIDGEEVALVRANLTPDLRERAVDWLLHEVLRDGNASCA